MPSSLETIQDPPSIAIIGGGPGGLSLLLTLCRRGIPATLYERDSDRHARAHYGGMLDLEWETGQRALRENGLEDVFKRYARRDAEEMRICGKDGVPLFRHRGEAPSDDDDLKDARPEIDRRVLREILLDAVPADAIKWGHALSSTRVLEDGKHEIAFDNGFNTVVHLVVGADGANSRIRPLLSPATPIYHGVTGAEISLPPALAALPGNSDINEGVGAGSCFATQDGKLLVFQRNGDGRIRAYAWHRDNLDWVLPSDPREAKETLLALYHDWAPWMRRFIELADESAIYHRPLFHLPVDHRWDHVRGVTILGDAAHLMSPFAGAGANLALLDGLELGLVLADAIGRGAGVEEREAAIAGWEEVMFRRVEKIATVTLRNLQATISPDAPQAVVTAFAAAMAEM